MKILKIFGIVAGIHLFALILIFANPGCSSTTRPPPAPSDTVSASQPPAAVSYPTAAPAPAPRADSSITFNPDAPAVASAGGSNVRFTPTRPGSPVAGTLVAEPVADVQPATTYTVVAGDNLWNLAKKHRVTVAELAAVNSLKTNAVLRPGQKLIIPGRPSSPTVAATANPAASAGETAKAVAVKTPPAQAVTHVVKLGETLGNIARRYGVKQGDIAVANNITNPQMIRAGMELVIPGWQTPAGKSGKAAKSSPDSAAKSDSRTAPKTEPSPPIESPPAPAEVPVIRVDDSPISPAPKN